MERGPTPIERSAGEAPQWEERAEPILKWAGGKTRLLPELLARRPSAYRRYHEPFLGGGALFFRLQPGGAVLSDANAELVNVYERVRDDVEEVIRRLRAHRYEREHYYRVRATDPTTLSPSERAARTLYLNRTCFNGLYRVNRRGYFNVPFGRYKNPVICRPERLRAVSRVLRRTTLLRADYEGVLDVADAGDFAYFDPPYQPVSRTANFTGYTAADFGEDEQRRLAEVVRELDRRGVRWMVSNSDTELVHELYGGFRVEAVQGSRAISRRGNGRGRVRELLIRNY